MHHEVTLIEKNARRIKLSDVQPGQVILWNGDKYMGVPLGMRLPGLVAIRVDGHGHLDAAPEIVELLGQMGRDGTLIESRESRTRKLADVTPGTVVQYEDRLYLVNKPDVRATALANGERGGLSYPSTQVEVVGTLQVRSNRD